LIGGRHFPSHRGPRPAQPWARWISARHWENVCSGSLGRAGSVRGQARVYSWPITIRGRWATPNHDGVQGTGRTCWSPTERIMLLTDADGDGKFDKKSRCFAEGFNTEITGVAGGACWRLTATSTRPFNPTFLGNWDRPRPARARRRPPRVSLSPRPTGHPYRLPAVHDMAWSRPVGPDGRIYWSQGRQGLQYHVQGGGKDILPGNMRGGVFSRVRPRGRPRNLGNSSPMACGNPQGAWRFDDYGKPVHRR